MTVVFWDMGQPSWAVSLMCLLLEGGPGGGCVVVVSYCGEKRVPGQRRRLGVCDGVYRVRQVCRASKLKEVACVGLGWQAGEELGGGQRLVSEKGSGMPCRVLLGRAGAAVQGVCVVEVAAVGLGSGIKRGELVGVWRCDKRACSEWVNRWDAVAGSG